MTGDEYIETQDNMRPLRMFVGAAAGLLAASDQSYANQDYYAANVPRQYYSMGPNGMSIEGSPVAVTRSGGLVLSPMLVFMGIGIVFALTLKR